MQLHYTAIIHLRDSAPLGAETALGPMLRVIPGVDDVNFEPDDSLITVEYDNEQTSLAEIVRVIEDSGSVVASVAQRKVQLRKAS